MASFFEFEERRGRMDRGEPKEVLFDPTFKG